MKSRRRSASNATALGYVRPVLPMAFGHLAHVGRTHPRAPLKSRRRAIHRLLNADRVCNCAVFFASPL